MGSRVKKTVRMEREQAESKFEISQIMMPGMQKGNANDGGDRGEGKLWTWLEDDQANAHINKQLGELGFKNTSNCPYDTYIYW